jgi:hypothetical protein
VSRGHSRHSGSGPGRHRGPAASAAALAFLDEVVTTTTAHSCGRIAMTQAELARRTGRSAGTVAYYLAQAGPDIVTKRRGGVVVDVHALGAARAQHAGRRRRRDEVADVLADTWGMPVDGGGVELRTAAGRAPTLAEIADQLGVARSTAQRHVTELDAQGRLRRRGGRLFLDLADTGTPPASSHPSPAPTVAGVDGSATAAGLPESVSPQMVVDIAHGLLEMCERLTTVAEHLLATAEGPRTSTRSPRERGAQTAGSRDDAGPVADGSSFSSTEQARKLAYLSANTEDLRADVRGRVGTPLDQVPAENAQLTDPQIDELLSPLTTACREYGLLDVIDHRGRRQLRSLKAEELSQAATRLERQLRTGYRLRSPLGVLVRAAMNGDHDLFGLPSSNPGAPGEDTRCSSSPSPASQHRSRELEAARRHAGVIASIADLDDDGRRDALADYYGKDPLLLEAALGALEGSRDAGDPADLDDAPQPAGRVMA